MIQRISGRRGTNAMSVISRPVGTVGPNEVLWVETGQPSSHELGVVWTVNGASIPNPHNSRNLALAPLKLPAGATVRATVSDPTEHVRDPEIQQGPTLTQTREWVVGATATPPATVAAAFTGGTPTDRPVAAGHVVYADTTHPTDRIDVVTWRLDGVTLPNPGNTRSFNLSTLTLTPGNRTLTATVGTETRTWTVDNTHATAPAELSPPLTVLPGATRHHVYFEGFDMKLTPQDDQPS
ncbi:MAG: hypothetical protein O2917_04490 [Acidobacteria bacterium]|nr:hypothetical protein [Acidobacteriota bacterium]